MKNGIRLWKLIRIMLKLYLILVLSYTDIDKIDEAIEAYQKAIELDEGLVQAYAKPRLII